MTKQLQCQKFFLALLFFFCWSMGITLAHASQANDDEISFEVVADVNPVAAGEVTGAGTYEEGAECTLVAIPNEGYSFVNWTENDSVVCVDSIYVFLVTEARTLMANFAEVVYTVSFDAGSGSCSTSALTETSWHSGVMLPVASPSTLCAAQGYTFVGWATEIIEGESVEPELLLAGSVFFPEEDVTLYAVYGNVQGGWVPARSVTNGDEVCLVSNDYKVEFNNINNSLFVGTSSAFTDVPTGRHPFTILMQDEASCMLVDQDGKYLSKASNNGALYLTNVDNSNGVWTIEMINGNVILRNSSHDSNHQLVAKVLGTSGEKVFACVPYPEGLGSGSKMVQLYRNTVNEFSSYDHTPECTSALQPPVISPLSDGLYLDPVIVTLSTTESDAKIYYTINGTTPTTSSPEYFPSHPISIQGTKTLKARVFKNGVGSATAQQTYLFPNECANIAAFKAAADDSQILKITSRMRVTKQYGRYLYVSDATGGLLLYDEYGFVNGFFDDGDYIYSAQGRYTVVDGQPMMLLWHSVDKTGETVPVEPVVLNIQDINDNYAEYEAQLVKIEGIHFSSSLEDFGLGNPLYVIQNGNSILTEDRFGNVNCAINAGYTYDVTGILSLKAGEPCICPRTNNDISRYYSITCNTVGEGSLSVSPEAATESTVITVNAVPSDNRHLESLYYYTNNPNIRTDIDLELMQFTMPAQNVTVVAVYAVNVNYTVALYKGSGSCAVQSLTETAWHSGVVLPEAAPSSSCAFQGYTFAGWSENYINETIERPKLYMAGSVYYPTENVALYAVYALGGTEWFNISDANQVIEGDYVVTTKYNNRYYYLPYEGVKNVPKALPTTINAQGVPAASSALWTLTRITEGANPQYSITYTENDTTYYLKAKADMNGGIQVTIHDPGTGWVFSNHPTKGLMACFPYPVPDPSKSTRYLGFSYKGLLASSWYFLTETIYQGDLHLFMSPPSTYCTEPVCESAMEDPTFVNLPEGVITDDSYSVTITHPDPSAAIYYTLDGTDPTSGSTLYSEPFYISDDCTVKAIAIDGYGRMSNIISHDFDFITRFANIMDFKMAYISMSSEEVKITGMVTVAYQSLPYLYICDATASLMVLDENNVVTGTYTNGTVLLQGVMGRMKVVHGQQMFVPTEDFGAGILNTPVMPVEVPATDLASYSYDAVLVTLKDVTVEQGYDFATDNACFAVTQGDNMFYVSDLFDHLTLSGDAGDCFDITGFVGTNTSIGSYKMLYPRMDDDFVRYYHVACDTTTVGGQVSASLTHAKPGTEVTITAVPEEGYVMDSVIVTDGNNQPVEVLDNSFVMPESNVFVSAVFVLDEEIQDIILSAGWTWFSSYVEYQADAVEQLETSIATVNNTAIIKNAFDFNQLNNGIWAGGVTLVNEMMYMTSLEEPVIYTIQGSVVTPEDHPITLSSEGWSWISFLSKDPMTVTQAFSGLTPSNGDQIKSQGNFSTYSSTADEWFGDVQVLEPGQGYQYFNGSESQTLIYPSAAKAALVPQAIEKHWNSDFHRFSTNLTMMVTLDATSVAMSEGSHEIGAFVDGECRGSALLKYVDGCYVAFLTVSGNQDEEVSFRLFDVNNNEEYAGVADERISYQADRIYGSLKTPMTLHFRNTSLNEYDEIGLFPNPTKDKVMIQGQGIETVKVYNAMGQLLYTEVCDNAENVTLHLSSFSAGVYTISVRLTNGQQSNHMVVKE